MRSHQKGFKMKYQKVLQVFLFIMALTVFSTSHARPFASTTGLNGVLNWSGDLKGKSFRNNPQFPAYCNAYARLAVKQAQRRNTERCTSRIPLYTSKNADRWSPHQWQHKQWCLSVSSYATERETLTRNRQLKNCVIRQSSNNNGRIRANCIRNDAIHKKAARGDVNFVRRCLRAGVSPNIRERNNWTPLHSAAKNGRLSVVRLLVQNRAQINTTEIHGNTALDLAARGNYRRVINYLRNKGGVRRR